MTSVATAATAVPGAPETHDASHCIDVCNSLLRGEISAVETYDKAIDKFSGEEQCSELQRIRTEHQRSVDQLREHVLSLGAAPDTSSGAWGVFANAVQSAANLFGENSALTSLAEGEDHGRKEYEKALDDDKVVPHCKALISEELKPRVERHLQTLEELIEANQ